MNGSNIYIGMFVVAATGFSDTIFLSSFEYTISTEREKREERKRLIEIEDKIFYAHHTLAMF